MAVVAVAIFVWWLLWDFPQWLASVVDLAARPDAPSYIKGEAALGLYVVSLIGPTGIALIPWVVTIAALVVIGLIGRQAWVERAMKLTKAQCRELSALLMEGHVALTDLANNPIEESRTRVEAKQNQIGEWLRNNIGQEESDSFWTVQLDKTKPDGVELQGKALDTFQLMNSRLNYVKAMKQHMCGPTWAA